MKYEFIPKIKNPKKDSLLDKKPIPNKYVEYKELKNDYSNKKIDLIILKLC